MVSDNIDYICTFLIKYNSMWSISGQFGKISKGNNSSELIQRTVNINRNTYYHPQILISN